MYFFAYQPFKSAFPPTFGFPNNPWDNLETNILNKDLEDEYDIKNMLAPKST